jgi:hypothetical protein
VHTSGLHGVEAYAGSAIQLALLASPPIVGERDALALVHVLNPYGMAWTRRTNENNVDLNRNFCAQASERSGAHPLYRKLNALLNPRSAPAVDAFPARAAAWALRHGFHTMKQAIAEGQYEYPHGLFYGGAQLEEGLRLYLGWLASHCAGAERLVAIDVHTGLGRWACDTLFAEGGCGAWYEELEKALGRTIVDAGRGRSVAYVTRGGLASAVQASVKDVQTCCIMQEFGTYGPLRVLAALREENRCHFHGSPEERKRARARLREALCPRSAQWRRRVVEQGAGVARTISRWLFARESA